MRALFCPLASHGFLFPMLGIAQEMKARGHSVAFVTDTSFAGLLEEHGFERIIRSAGNDGPSFQLSLWSEASWVAVQVKHTEHAVRVFQPDLLVGSPLTLGPLIVAERTGLPVALLGFCTYQWPTDVSSLKRPADKQDELLAWRIRGWTQLYNEAREIFHMPPVPVDLQQSPGLGDRFMLRAVPELIDGLSELPQAVRMVGACLWEPNEPDTELEDWLGRAEDSGRPILYVQHGRFFGLQHFWPALKQAVDAGGFWVAVSTSRMDCDVGDLPERFLARPFLPQGRVLRHSDLMITGGTTTAALGALVEGVPALLIPGGGEQPDVAAHCSRVGTAHVLSPPESVGSEQILDGIRHVLGTEELKRNALRMKGAFARLSGFGAAADVLEAMERPMTKNREESSARERRRIA